MSALSWSLTDLSQSPKASLLNRFGGQVTIGRSDRRTAQVTISPEDAAAAEVSALDRLLCVWLDEAPIFKGRLTVPLNGDPAGGGEGSITLYAQDPAFQLERNFIRSLATQTGVDQSEIMARIVENVDPSVYGYPSHGVKRGSLPATVNRDRTYADGTQAWQALVDMSALIGGIDFELEPFDGGGQRFVRLNTYASQGSDKSASVALEYETGSFNAQGFTVQPGGDQVINQFTAAGQAETDDTTGEQLPAPAYVASCVDSMSKYGVFAGFEALTDVTEPGTLAAYAALTVARYAYPIDNFTIVPGPEEGAYAGQYPDSVPPRFAPDGDYWIGDTIAVRAEKPNGSYDLKGRVDAATFSEDEDGAVSVSLTLSTVTDPATVTGAATTVNLVSS